MYERAITYVYNRWPVSAQIFRYLVAGGTASLTELAFLYGFTQYLGIWYVYSVVLAFAIAFSISFTLQKMWTFRDRELVGAHKQASLYLFVSLVNLLFNVIAIYILVQIVGIWYLFAQIIIDAVIAISSFLIYKFLIFDSVP